MRANEAFKNFHQQFTATILGFRRYQRNKFSDSKQLQKHGLATKRVNVRLMTLSHIVVYDWFNLNLNL